MEILKKIAELKKSMQETNQLVDELLSKNNTISITIVGVTEGIDELTEKWKDYDVKIYERVFDCSIIDWPVFFQSSKKADKPLSVRG